MSEEAKTKSQIYMDKLDKWAERVRMWRESHGDRLRPPIHEDKDGNWHWVNRKERRKMGIR